MTATKKELTPRRLHGTRSQARKKPGQRRPLRNNPDDIEEVVRQLRLHVAELETRNEELRAAQIKIEDLQTKYRDLYESSPVGYFTLDKWGIVEEANRTGALLLGTEKVFLVGSRFLQFVDRTCRNVFLHYLRRLLESDDKQLTELLLVRKDNHQFHGLVEGMRVSASGRPFEIRLSLSDITKIKKTANKLQDIYEVLTGGAPGTVGTREVKVLGDHKAGRSETGDCPMPPGKTESPDTTVSQIDREREDIRKALEDRLILNITNLVLPLVEGLRRSGLNDEQKKCAVTMESALREITSSFMQKAVSRYPDLTPREIQIAGFIRYGHTTKEIAQIMGVSLNAIEIHRGNLRKKFDLRHKKTNLHSFLLSLPL